MRRLDEIYIQVLGVRALQDPEVSKKLGITTRQKERIEEVQTESRDKIRSQMESLFQSGDREQIREKMTEFRKESDNKVLAILTTGQKKTFEQMKGEPLELPEDALRGGGGGGRGGRGGGQGGRGGGQRGRERGQGQGAQGRPQRPATDN
jgi:hypothetical protein